MWTSDSRRARQVAVWAAVVAAALLVTACNSATSSAASSAASTARTPSPGSPAVLPSVTPSKTRASTFLAEGQEINGTALYEPACGGYGCALSGDSTAFLYHMKWATWSATEAVGTGTYKLNDCRPNCAAGTVYPVATVVTLSQPVKACSSSGTRWFWSRASFAFPDGLPRALQGQDAPQNPWTFGTVVAAARQSCA
jgi:hypothetical protein